MSAAVALVRPIVVVLAALLATGLAWRNRPAEPRRTATPAAPVVVVETPASALGAPAAAIGEFGRAYDALWREILGPAGKHARVESDHLAEDRAPRGPAIAARSPSVRRVHPRAADWMRGADPEPRCHVTPRGVWRRPPHGVASGLRGAEDGRWIP